MLNFLPQCLDCLRLLHDFLCKDRRVLVVRLEHVVPQVPLRCEAATAAHKGAGKPLVVMLHLVVVRPGVGRGESFVAAPVAEKRFAAGVFGNKVPILLLVRSERFTAFTDERPLT